ncbi:hypothetical protein C8Q76DRAFT_790652 [Earliella scabrosa]|nr:hypothetical protein C8Q76DRAFT_790652 [Earliella scabrosa]
MSPPSSSSKLTSSDTDVESGRRTPRHPTRLETPVRPSRSENTLPTSRKPKRGMSFCSVCTEAVWVRIGAKDAPNEYAGVRESIWYVVRLSGINVLFLALPFAWAAHWNVEQWGHDTTFILCFIAMIPLQKMFDWGGEEISAFLEEDLRDLLVITLSNAVEATLAILLLHKCELRLLQSTIIGVVLLHLLLIPGTAFFVEGTQVFQQMLQPHHANLNVSLLMIGVLATLVPTAFFAALDRGDTSSRSGLPPPFVPLVSDFVRRDILRMSRGISVILLVIYATSRIYRHVFTRTASRPGMNSRRSTATTTLDVNLASTPSDPDTPPRKRPGRRSPVHPWVCVVMLIIAIALMAVTAEFLVTSIDPVRETSGIQTEWFGLVLLPIVSFSADGVIAIWKFSQPTLSALTRPLYNKFLKTSVDKLLVKIHKPAAQPHSSHLAQVHASGDSDDDDPGLRESEFAHGRPIDLSIQFTLWWTPFLVLLGWWTDRPMHLLFDYFEVAMLLGACFLVNYIMADSMTNMAEGLTMISFYAMIATAVWFYPGQPQVEFMLNCPGTVAEAVASGVEVFRV